MKYLTWLDDFIDKFSSFFLVIAICLIFLLSLTGICLRWVNLSPQWIDPLIRHMVFVSAFFAGAIITGKQKHISVDLLNMYLEKHRKLKRFFRRIVYLVSFAVLIGLIKAGLIFLSSEMEYGRAEFLGIHNAFWVSVIPFGFALIAYRFFYLFVASFKEEK
jgi:TRAP-type C4-dicarboxylate transport system permease small subunit